MALNLEIPTGPSLIDFSIDAIILNNCSNYTNFPKRSSYVMYLHVGIYSYRFMIYSVRTSPGKGNTYPLSH